MKKLKFLLVLLFLVPLVSCKQENKITIAEVTHSIFYAPQYIAIENGYFLEEGLEVDIITTPGADKTMAALLSKEAQIGLMGPEASMYVYLNGQEDYAINFAQLTQKDGSFLVSKEPIKNFEWDMLKGKTIIGGRLGGMPEMVLEYVLKQHGLEVGVDDPTKEVHVRTDISFDVMAGAFSSGQGDFVALFEPTATQVINNNKGHMVLSLGEEAGEIPYTCYSSLKSYMLENDTNITKFTKAIYKALLFVNTHSAHDIAVLLQKYFASNTIEEITTVVQRYKDIQAWPMDLTLAQQSYERLMDIAELAGQLSQRVDYNTLVTTKYSENVK